MVTIHVNECWRPGGPVLWWGVVNVGEPPMPVYSVHARASECEAYEACARYLLLRGRLNILGSRAPRR